jgi:threonine dehydrogenase-like Zn-dependent dehydrogenase
VENLSNNFPDIVSAHYPLEKVTEAFERANNDKNVIKVIIDVND